MKYILVVARWISWVRFDKGLGDKNVGDGVGAGVGDTVVELLEKFLGKVEANTSPLKATNHKISNNLFINKIQNEKLCFNLIYKINFNSN